MRENVRLQHTLQLNPRNRNLMIDGRFQWKPLFGFQSKDEGVSKMFSNEISFTIYFPKLSAFLFSLFLWRCPLNLTNRIRNSLKAKFSKAKQYRIFSIKSTSKI